MRRRFWGKRRYGFKKRYFGFKRRFWARRKRWFARKRYPRWRRSFKPYFKRRFRTYRKSGIFGGIFREFGMSLAVMLVGMYIFHKYSKPSDPVMPDAPVAPDRPAPAPSKKAEVVNFRDPVAVAHAIDTSKINTTGYDYLGVK